VTGPRCRFAAAVIAMLLLLLVVAPRGVTAGQLTLTWVDDGATVLGFSIERSTGTSSQFVEIAIVGRGITSYIDDSVADATAYCYRVRGFDETSYSDYSDVACSPALVVTLSVNAITLSNGDDLVAYAHIHVKAHFLNPVDGYLYLQDQVGSVVPVATYVGVDVVRESPDFIRTRDLGTVAGLPPGVYTLWLVVVRAGGDPQVVTDRLSNVASTSFQIQ